MLNCFNVVLSGRASKGLAAMAVVCAAGAANAQTDITLVDHSFELLALPTPGPGADISEGVLPFFQSPLAPFNPNGWQETGVPTSQQGFTGFLDAGIFLNASFDLGGGFMSPTVPNADDNQLAFLRFSADANTTGPATTLSQQTTENFDAFTRYTFTMAIGQGQLQPGGSDEPTTNPFTAILSIGFYDNASSPDGGFTALASEVISTDDLVGDGSGLLTDFSVVYETDDALFTNPLVIHIEQAGGSTGGINLDNARLTSLAVPEPTSLALLGLGGLLLSRRRRS